MQLLLPYGQMKKFTEFSHVDSFFFYLLPASSTRCVATLGSVTHPFGLPSTVTFRCVILQIIPCITYTYKCIASWNSRTMRTYTLALSVLYQVRYTGTLQAIPIRVQQRLDLCGAGRRRRGKNKSSLTSFEKRLRRSRQKEHRSGGGRTCSSKWHIISCRLIMETQSCSFGSPYGPGKYHVGGNWSKVRNFSLMYHIRDAE